MTYFQHGRRHSPHGTDPIPSTETPWALLDIRDPVTVTSPSSNVGLDFDAGTNGYFTTNDTARFAVSAYASGGFSGLHGLRIITPGFYKISFSCNMSGTPATGTHYEVEARESSGGSSYLGNFFYGQNTLQFWVDASGSKNLGTYALAWTQLWEIEADLANQPFIITATQATGVSLTATAAIFAELVNGPLGDTDNF